MADTGLPWELPYPLSTDLVRDGATAIQALAEATADGLDAAGGLVAVKFAVKTDTQSSSLAAQGTAAISGLTIAHSVADDTNVVYLFAQIQISPTTTGLSPGAFLTAAGNAINIGAAAGARARVQAQQTNTDGANMASMTLVSQYVPGVTSSVTYGVNIINVRASGDTVHVNRSNTDTDAQNFARAASTLVLMEVKV